MKTVMRDPETLVPYERNPRENKAAIESVASSIERYGWKQPIVVDEHDVIIAGHTRREAAIRLKHAEVPVVVAEGLSDDAIRVLRVADNRTADFSTWDIEALREEIADIDMPAFTYIEDLLGHAEDEGEDDSAIQQKKQERKQKAGSQFFVGEIDMTVPGVDMNKWFDDLSEEKFDGDYDETAQHILKLLGVNHED